MIYDLVIIGGGSSGIACYLTYKEKNPNKKVLIIEHNNELLKKFSATGNGRLNMTNENLCSSIFNNGEYYKELLDNSLDKVLNFYNKYDILSYKDNEGRYYPISESAKNARNLLLKHVNVKDYTLNTVVLNVKKIDNYFIEIKSDNEINTIETKSLLIATGSINNSRSGSDGSMFKIIEELGHSFTNIYPSNIYINIKDIKFSNKVIGTRVRAKVSLYNNNEFIYSETGEVLFKEKALSGIVMFNVSNRLAHLYKENTIKNPYLVIDFIPYIDENKIYKEDLNIYLTDKLNDLFINSNNKIKDAKSYRFNIDSLGDFENAQSVCGGIVNNEINDKLESKINKNLYFSGDILDCDAPCGGYSLSFAILSGMKVGEEVE